MFKENFIQLCAQKGESPSSVCKKVGISAAAFSQWNEHTVPRKVTQQRIADYFGVTVSSLLGTEEVSKGVYRSEELTEHEKAVLQAYRLQVHLQEAVDRVLGVEKDGTVLLFAAAQSEDDRPASLIRKDQKSWNKIKNTCETDDPLL